MKLSDTQHLILSSASQRTDHAAVLPANLKGGAAKKVIDKLVNGKLLQELRAKDEMPVWHECLAPSEAPGVNHSGEKMFRFQTQTARDASGAGIRGGLKAKSARGRCCRKSRKSNSADSCPSRPS